MRVNRVLVVEDEEGVRFGIRNFLVAHGFQVDEAAGCRDAEEKVRASPPDVAILDYHLPDGDALNLLGALKSIDPELPVAILTAYATIDLAVRAIKEGAEQFLTKPVELPALLVLLRRMIDHRRSRRRQLAQRAREARAFVDPFLGTSSAIRRLAAQARKVTETDSPILIQGETGAGKGVLARWLHVNGPRAEEAFVDLNCAGLSREFLETELFGHEKGAFTGAVGSKAGLLEVADGGTVFLDEIGDMDLQVQPKLLKVLEEKRFRRLGNVSDRQVDVRLISATHEDLTKLLREKAFRSDLYFRVSAMPLWVPPLRQRVEDIPILARSLLRGIAGEVGRGDVALSTDAEAALATYSWPGNIREMRNVLERGLLLAEGDRLTSEHLRFEFPPPTDTPTEDTGLTLAEVERRYIERVLAEEHGNVGVAAQRLGVPKSSLYQRIKKRQVSSPK
jgi:DNA-binding NtrC family response regulator